MTSDQGLVGRRTRISLAVIGPIAWLFLFAAVTIAQHYGGPWDGFGFTIVGIPITIGLHVLAGIGLLAVGLSRGIVYKRIDTATVLGLLYYATILTVLSFHYSRTRMHH